MENIILVVDDDSGILDVIRTALEIEGYEVITADRWNRLFNNQNKLPRVILLDVLLSGQDGRDVASKLKDNPMTKNIPVIMMSAYPQVQQASLAAGADAFISKPFDLDRLLTLVGQYIDTPKNLKM